MRCPSDRLAHPKYDPMVFRMPTARDPIPSAMEATFASSNMLGEAAFRKAIMPDPIMTGKSIQVLRVLYIASAFLCTQARQWAFSPVDAKYSSSFTVQ